MKFLSILILSAAIAGVRVIQPAPDYVPVPPYKIQFNLVVDDDEDASVICTEVSQAIGGLVTTYHVIGCVKDRIFADGFEGHQFCN